MKSIVSVEGGGFALRDVPEAETSAGEALVRVRASSVNPRDIRMARHKAGLRPGADFAGVVERAAGRGGPQPGDRVFGVIPSGGWAERIAVPTRALCKLPDELDFADAAAIASTGLTALYALERHGSLLGRRVLITGAGGGVGRLACEIAVAAGAQVTGWVRSQDAAAALVHAGVAVVMGETVAAARERGPYDALVDMVGGDALSDAVKMLVPGGRCLIVGNASGASTTLDMAEFYMNRRELTGFALFPELDLKPAAEGLRRLVGLWRGRAISVPPITRVEASAVSSIGDAQQGKTVLLF